MVVPDVATTIAFIVNVAVPPGAKEPTVQRPVMLEYVPVPLELVNKTPVGKTSLTVMPVAVAVDAGLAALVTVKV